MVLQILVGLDHFSQYVQIRQFRLAAWPCSTCASPPAARPGRALGVVEGAERGVVERERDGDEKKERERYRIC